MSSSTLDKCRAVYLTAEDLRIAASILYNSYYNDPFFIEVLGSDNKMAYEQKLRAAIREELNSLWQKDQALIGLFDDQRMLGIACIMTQEVPLGEERYWNWRLKMMLGTGWQPTQALIDKESQILKHLPSKQCGILQFIAVAPNEQNKGYGRTLVHTALSWCDEQPQVDGIGVFVNQADHYELFVNTGFRAITEIEINNVKGDLLFIQGKVMAKKFQSFKEFYPFYLSQHSNQVCRSLHYIGSILVLVTLGSSIYSQNYHLLWLLPIIGYGFAWIGHFFFEKNKPATFKYPLYSLIGDWVMLWDWITGRKR